MTDRVARRLLPGFFSRSFSRWFLSLRPPWTITYNENLWKFVFLFTKLTSKKWFSRKEKEGDTNGSKINSWRDIKWNAKQQETSFCDSTFSDIFLYNANLCNLLRKTFTFPCGCHSILVSADRLGSFVPQLVWWRRFLFFLRFFWVPFLSPSLLFLTAERWNTTCGCPFPDTLWFFDGSMRYSFLLVRM